MAVSQGVSQQGYRLVMQLNPPVGGNVVFEITNAPQVEFRRVGFYYVSVQYDASPGARFLIKRGAIYAPAILEFFPLSSQTGGILWSLHAYWNESGLPYTAQLA